MRRFKIITLTALSALAVSALAASSASADLYSCTFTGAAGPINGYDDLATPEDALEVGVEAIVPDLLSTEGDSPDPLLDTDNGNFRMEGSGEDGEYAFDTATAEVGAVECLFVETNGDAGRETGVYDGDISSEGEYDNVVCGTGWAVDDDVNTDSGAAEVTTVDLPTQVLPGVLGTGGTAANITDADYRIDFTAGQGVLDIRGTTVNADGELLSGDGVVSIEPVASVLNPNLDPGTPPVACVTADVTGFQASGAFVAGVGL